MELASAVVFPVRNGSEFRLAVRDFSRIRLRELFVLIHELFNAILLCEFDSEVYKGLLLLDEFLVLDPVVARVDLAYQVEPLLLLLLCDGTISDFIIKVGKLALISVVLCLTLIFIRIECLRLSFLDSLFCNFRCRFVGTAE